MSLARPLEPDLSSSALRDSEIRYRRLFEAAQDGILLLDADSGAITDVNPFLEKLLEYTHAELLGKALWEIGLFKDIEDSKLAFEELKREHYVQYDDMPLKSKSGKCINVEFVSNVYQEDRKQVIQCNVRDITKRINAAKIKEQAQQSQKMETVGQLAGGIAHDFNNLLGVILGYCELLEKRKSLSPVVRRMVGEISDAGISAKHLTRQLLAFSRRQVVQPVLVDLNSALTKASTMLKRMMGDDIEIITVLGDDLGTVRVDPNQLEQVLMNLSVNARDAMPRCGKLTFSTSVVERKLEQRDHDKTSDSFVLLTVADDGIGMTDATQTQIFDPFFSTKGASGTGLGLSIVLGILDNSAATIAVQSALGQGTTFSIRFPRHQDAPTKLEKQETAVLIGGRETILLVEDSVALRELTSHLLRGCGYTVLDAADPSEAILIAERHKGPLPLLVTDIALPGINGHELAQRLTSTRPEMRVLYTSGFIEIPEATHANSTLNCAFLEKPFTNMELITTVRGLLDGPERLAGWVPFSGSEGQNTLLT